MIGKVVSIMNEENLPLEGNDNAAPRIHDLYDKSNISYKYQFVIHVKQWFSPTSLYEHVCSERFLDRVNLSDFQKHNVNVHLNL
jgi:hypothetical protein